MRGARAKALRRAVRAQAERYNITDPEVIRRGYRASKRLWGAFNVNMRKRIYVRGVQTNEQ